MMRQDAGGERAHLATREVELARAAERTRRQREASGALADRRPGRVRTAAANALQAAIVRLDPARREPQLGRDGGC